MSSKATGKNGTGGTRSKNKLDKIAVNLEYACYICGNILSSPKQTINHVRKTHGRELPTRAIGIKRPQSNKYTYVRDKKGSWTIQEYACPSCWFHCPEDDIEALNQHTLEEHQPQKVDPKTGELLSEDEDDNEGYATDTSAMSGRSGRSIRSIASKSAGGGMKRAGSVRSSSARASSSAAEDSKNNDGNRSRRGSVVSFEKIEKDDPEVLDTGKELTRKLEELIKLFKSMFS